MILLMLIINIAIALPLAIPIFLLLQQTAGGTLRAQHLYSDNLDAIWLSDFFNERFAHASPGAIAFQLLIMLLVFGGIYVVINILLAGGIIEVLASPAERFTMKKFWSGCGTWFWRFFRLALIASVFYGLSAGLFLLLRFVLEKSEETATVERPEALKSMGAYVLVLLLFSVVGMVFDYARIATVIGDKRKMIREALRAWRFCLRRLFNTFSLYLAVVVAGLLVFAILSWLRGVVHQTSLFGILLAFLIGQLAMASRMWTRLACYATELGLYRQLVPASAIQPAEAGSTANESRDSAEDEQRDRPQPSVEPAPL
jgi:hypothetical protein